MVNESVLSAMADLLGLKMCDVRGMSMTSTLEVAIGAIQSTLSSSNSRIGDLVLDLALKTSYLDAPTTEPDSTELASLRWKCG